MVFLGTNGRDPSSHCPDQLIAACGEHGNSTCLSTDQIVSLLVVVSRGKPSRLFEMLLVLIIIDGSYQVDRPSGANVFAMFVYYKQSWGEGNGEESENGISPAISQRCVHFGTSQREESASNRAKYGVCRHCRGGIDGECIDEISHHGHEEKHVTYAH